MIEKVLDEYEIKARIAPAIVLVLPPVVAVFYLTPALGSWPVFATGGIFCLVLVYSLGYLVRWRGESIERILWALWDGAPSTRFLRHRDRTLPDRTKAIIRKQVAKRFSVSLPGTDEERREPGRADQVISDAFQRVREFLRQRNPNGLWFKHNTEYGFCRNLLGSRVLLLLLALASSGVTAVRGRQTGAGILNVATSIELSFVACSAYYGWKLLPDATRRVADAYAEAAWLAFVDLAEQADAASPVSRDASNKS